MPSPFPGMDPFLEGPSWPDFHLLFISEIRSRIVPRARTKYTVEAERRVYIETDPGDPDRIIRPDVVLAGGAGEFELGVPTESLVTEPAVVTVPMRMEHREAFLTVRLRETREVVTVIEVLSPANKRAGSDGRDMYLDKREAILDSRTHLVELDLLRGGERLPTNEGLPPADYYGLVCRGNRRPKAEVYHWTIRQKMPKIPIPLLPPDPDILLDMQELFDSVYDRAGYDYSLDYTAGLSPALAEPDTDWAKDLLHDSLDR